MYLNANANPLIDLLLHVLVPLVKPKVLKLPQPGDDKVGWLASTRDKGRRGFFWCLIRGFPGVVELLHNPENALGEALVYYFLQRSIDYFGNQDTSEFELNNLPQNPPSTPSESRWRCQTQAPPSALGRSS